MQQTVLRRALASGDARRLHVRFDAAVIERYRERGAQVVRTRSVGRIAVPGSWSLDVGIASDGVEVHVPFEDLATRLPEAEREHWIAHLVGGPASAVFLQMRLAPGACIDDGDTEAWTR